MMSDVRNELAAYEHKMWSQWMTGLFSQCDITLKKDSTLPQGIVQYWKMISALPLDVITESGPLDESYLKNADEIIAIFSKGNPHD